jgi:Ino eighty subunit 2
MAGDETPDGEESKANPVFVRWVSNKNGVVVAVPDEILGGPAGRVFAGNMGMRSGKMVEEVS